jgi:hypothetical protein
MMILKINMNLFWLLIVIYLVNLVEIWLICNEVVMI